jgi:uncharacterized protein
MMAEHKGRSAAVEVLLEAGAAVNLANGTGITALHSAARNGREAIVKLLLEAGADARIVDVVMHS